MKHFLILRKKSKGMDTVSSVVKTHLRIECNGRCQSKLALVRQPPANSPRVLRWLSLAIGSSEYGQWIEE